MSTRRQRRSEAEQGDGAADGEALKKEATVGSASLGGGSSSSAQESTKQSGSTSKANSDSEDVECAGGAAKREGKKSAKAKVVQCGEGSSQQRGKESTEANVPKLEAGGPAAAGKGVPVKVESGSEAQDKSEADVMAVDESPSDPSRRSTSTIESEQGEREGRAPAAGGAKQKRSSASGGNCSSGKLRRGKSSVSNYRGVAVHRWTGRWEAHIWENGKQLYLGSFETEAQAAKAYDKAAIKLKKDDAVLNFNLEDYKGEIESLAEMTKEELITSLRRDSAGFARGTCTFRGVSWRKQTGRWEARIGRLLGRKYTYLGTFKSGEAAARAYDHAAIVSRGREAITNYHLNEYKDKLEAIERATPEERRRMEEEIILRPQAVGAKQRRKRFEASASDSQISGKSQTGAVEKEDIIEEERDIEQARRFKRIKSCPPAMRTMNEASAGGTYQRNISVNLTVTASQQLQNSALGVEDFEGGNKNMLMGANPNTGKGGKKSTHAQNIYERSTMVRQRVLQRTLTGNVRVPMKVEDPSFAHQPYYAPCKGNQAPIYQQYNGPTFKPAPPSGIEKFDLLFGDYFSGVPDGSEYTWKQTVSDVECGYPEPIGAMLGMTGSVSTFMPPPHQMPAHYEEFSQQGPADKHGTIFNNQIPTKNELQWGGPEQEHLDGTFANTQYLSDFLQEDQNNEAIPIENVQNCEVNPAHAGNENDELAAIDNLDGTSMNKILVDMGFSGDNLFTWHT